MLTFLTPGDGPRVLGLTAQDRNRRVLRRAGLALTAETVAGPGSLLIPPTVVITHEFAERVQLAGWAAPDLLTGPGVYDVSTAAARRAAERAILRATVKPSDGWVSRNLNRPVSRALSRLLLRLGLTPFHATLLSALTGLAAALAAAHPSDGALVAAGALFHLASIVDGVDGEIARATLSESEAGARFDTTVDYSTHAASCLGFVVGWFRVGLGPWETLLALGAPFSLLLAMAQGARFMRQHAPGSSWVFIDRSVAQAAETSGHWSFRVVRLMFQLFRRDAFALVFFLLAFTGQRAVYCAGLSLAAAVALLTFWLRSDQLATAAAAVRCHDSQTVCRNTAWH